MSNMYYGVGVNDLPRGSSFVDDRSEKCYLVPARLNNLITTKGCKVNIGYREARRTYPCGEITCYQMECSNGKQGKEQRYISKLFKTPKEAHNAWRFTKADVIEYVVEEVWNDYPNLPLKIKEALLLRATKLRDFSLKVADFY